MFAAVVHRLLAQQDSSEALAAAIGCTVFEARTMLAQSATPAVVSVDVDPTVVERHAAALRRAGFGAVAVAAQTPPPDLARTWLITDHFEVQREGRLVPLPWNQIRCAVVASRRETHSYTTEAKQPAGVAAMTAGPRSPVIPETVKTVHNVEKDFRHATLLCADGTVLRIDEVESRPENATAFPTRTTAFDFLLDSLRRNGVTVDERLRNRGAQQRVLRPPLVPDRNLDLAVHLVAQDVAGTWSDAPLVATPLPRPPRPARPIPSAQQFAAKVKTEEQPRRRWLWAAIIAGAVGLFLAGSPQILERLDKGPPADAGTPFVVSVVDGTSRDARRMGTEHLPMLKKCYERVGATDPELEGKMVVPVAVGTISATDIEGGNAPLRECVATTFGDTGNMLSIRGGLRKPPEGLTRETVTLRFRRPRTLF